MKIISIQIRYFSGSVLSLFCHINNPVDQPAAIFNSIVSNQREITCRTLRRYRRDNGRAQCALRLISPQTHLSSTSNFRPYPYRSAHPHITFSHLNNYLLLLPSPFSSVRDRTITPPGTPIPLFRKLYYMYTAPVSSYG